ncbi:hypothetical protein BH10PSE19_BH10PSE19_01520 [soil metagenome]
MTVATAIIFDTLAYAKKLKAVGVPEAQAEVQASTFAQIIEEQIATKQDLKEVESNLLVALKELELRTETKSAEMKAEIIKWVIAVSAAQAALVASFTKFLH